jgi:murein DD-endopeptidase MepM/ murein hydrolase activator NlpD
MRRFSIPAVLLLAACVRNPHPRQAPEPVVVAAPPAPAATDLPAVPTPNGMDRDDAMMLQERMLMVPVAGVQPTQLHDTFNEKRGGGRTHRALDILAPRGTPVLAADEGLVLSVRTNKLGGRTVYMLDPARRLVYYYAHLDRWADGLAEGQALAKGDVIGYVGTTGNAPRDTPHLHFQVMRLDDPKRYWDGLPLDARLFFAHDGRPNHAPDRQAAR